MVTSFVEFRSRVDRFYAWVFWGSCLALLAAALFTLNDPEAGPGSRIGVVLIVGATIPFMLWILFGTSYRLTDTHLLVRHGPFRKKILLDEVTEVIPEKSLQSSFALARDRFLVRYGNFNTVSISPDDRGGFLKEMAERTPHLVWRDSNLVSLS